jgi:hypothetical protein
MSGVVFDDPKLHQLLALEMERMSETDRVANWTHYCAIYRADLLAAGIPTDEVERMLAKLTGQVYAELRILDLRRGNTMGTA